MRRRNSKSTASERPTGGSPVPSRALFFSLLAGFAWLLLEARREHGTPLAVRTGICISRCRELFDRSPGLESWRLIRLIFVIHRSPRLILGVLDSSYSVPSQVFFEPKAKRQGVPKPLVFPTTVLISVATRFENLRINSVLYFLSHKNTGGECKQMIF